MCQSNFSESGKLKFFNIFNGLPNLESNCVNWNARKGNVSLPWRRKSAPIRIVSVISIRSEIRKIAPSQPRDGDARLLVEWTLVPRRNGRRAARRSISDVGQGERARPVRSQRLLDRLDHIVAAVFARQRQVVTQHRAGAYVDDHQQPDALDFEFLFEAKRVADHYLQAHIELVSVEFDHLVGTNGAAAGGAGHALEMRGAGGARRVTEVGEYFRRHVGRQ